MKKFLILIFIMVLSLGITACATDTPDEEPIDDGPVTEVPAVDNEDENDDVDPIEDEEDVDEVVDPEPETNTETVTLYFVDEDYVITGDESGEIILTEEREIEYGDTSLEEAVVNELREGPEGEGLYTLIPETIELLGVEVEDGTAFVDFSSEGLGGGSMQETFTIRQIVNSLTDLDSVDRVQFLVDGQKAESLMGHIGITEPFEREE